jgi:CheY-like chemotaxis protein
MSLELNHGSARVLADYHALSFAFINICYNAKEAMPNGGMLSIRTRQVTKTIESEEVQFVAFEFRDTGCGISKEQLALVREPFFTTHDAAGMGLTITDEIIAAHGGELDIESVPGEGTSVMVWIPVKLIVSDTTNKRKSLKRAEINEQRGMKKQVIMVVDDEADLREMAKTILENRGYDVLVAGSGDMAVEVFKENASVINLVILDMIMPGMDGAKVYRELKSLSHNSKFILTSGYINDSPFQEIIDREEEIFVPKPWDLPHLISEAQRVLNIDVRWNKKANNNGQK